MIRPDELVADNFAGGGGASTGIEQALGRPIDYAINHSREALALHAVNHPHTEHFCEDVWAVDPAKLCAGRPVGLCWLSPDCTHFSRAKGGKPRSKKSRALAWVAIRWARAVRPRIIMLENVPEFSTWGPLGVDGRPCPKRQGRTFKLWLSKLRKLGYAVEWRELVAADYGAPTTRKRLFLIARCDGAPIVWPEATHGKGRANARRPAAECIDWSVPVRSIFGRKKPLAEKTLARIAAGIRRYVVETAVPFIVKHHGGDAEFRGQGLDTPFVSAFITKHFGGVVGHEMERPFGAVTTRDHHSLTTAKLAPANESRAPEVRSFLVKYYEASGNTGSQQQELLSPLHTVTTRARFGLVTVAGVDYEIVDIGMRMLTPGELFAAQGFPGTYAIDARVGKKRLTKTAQIALAGNSVCPPLARALVEANLGAPSERRAAA